MTNSADRHELTDWSRRREWPGWGYVQIARVDHWFKNVFMVLGVLVALLYEPALFTWSTLPQFLVAVLATCCVASSNYVLNELLDAPTDREHPVKRERPVPAGRVRPFLAWIEWYALAGIAFALAGTLGRPFVAAAFSLWVMGMIYNVPPARAKELPYLDVLVESVNNPIRLMLGWCALIQDRLPPVSLMLAYWALGAFFMATKRFAELRALGDRELAARYRRSFAHYTEERLLVSLVFYALACAFFGGIFIVRCKMELVLCVPLIAGMLAYYLALGLRPNSPVQHPERLHRERGFFFYSLFTFGAFLLLTFVEIPMLYDLFDIERPELPALWRLD